MKLGSLFLPKLFLLACFFLSSNLFAMEKGLSRDELKSELQKAFDSGNVETFKTVLKKVQNSKYPDLINASEFLYAAFPYDEFPSNGTLLHQAVAENKLEIIKELINAKADVNKTSDGETPLHIAAKYGNLDIVKYLVENAKANINLKNESNKKPADLAKTQEIADYLFSKAFPNTIQISNLMIFIDHIVEINKPEKAAVSNDLKQAITEKAAPCLIFGKHLLNNVKDSLDLDEWIVLDFAYKSLDGFLLIPKDYAQNWLKKDISKIELKKTLEGLGFSLPEDFKTKEIKNKTEIQNETIGVLNEEKFSKLVPEAVDKLLTDSDQKCVYLDGHGSSIQDSQGGAIADLYIKDALKLFFILEKKNTRLVYVSTCFLGGENLLAVQDSLNKNLNKGLSASKPSDMIFISGATTQAVTGQIPNSFKNFFKEFKIYLNKEVKLKNLASKIKQLSKEENDERTKLTKKIGTLRAARQYFVEITKWLTDYDVSAIPQIRFPTVDAKFYSLAPAVIDEITLGSARGVAFKGKQIEPKMLEFSNQKILVINVPEIDVPIKIKGQIPILISGIGLRNFSLDNIEIQVQECDFFTFMSKAIKGEYKLASEEGLFSSVPYQETFTIKKLILTKNTKTSEGKDTLPNTLYDVSILRGNNQLIATFKDQKPKTKNYKSYKYDGAKLFEINEEALLKESLLKKDQPKKDLLEEDLLKAFASGDITKLKKALVAIKASKYPDLINSVTVKDDDSDNSLLHEAVIQKNIDKVKTLVEAGADVNIQTDIGSGEETPLYMAASNGFLNIVKYLAKDAKADINKKNTFGETPFHIAASKGKMDIVKFFVEDLKIDLNSKDDYENTAEDLALKSGKTEIADYLASKKQK